MAAGRHRTPRATARVRVRRGRLVRLAVGSVVGSCLLLGGGHAVAFWSTAGVGTSAAGAGTVAALTVSGSVTGGPLSPGVSRGLAVTLTNAGSAAVTVTSIAGVVASTGIAGCPTSSVTVATSTVSVAVPAGGTASVTVPSAATMTTTAPSACQGASYALTLTASGRLG